ncbi:MAG: DUF4810 domain-containing protein [Candidatus Symbiodolus clandestinus]
MAGFLKIGPVAAVLLLGACSSAPPQLYCWDQYEKTLYQYYQPEKSSFAEQVSNLEKVVAQAAAKGKKVPPGLHAHLGLLYSKLGQTGKALQQFEAEKQSFPEATAFMGFLLKKQSRSGL